MLRLTANQHRCERRHGWIFLVFRAIVLLGNFFSISVNAHSFVPMLKEDSLAIGDLIMH